MRFGRVIGAMALVATGIAACGGDESTAPQVERFVIPLSGLNERPTPVTTTASGNAVVTIVTPDSIDYLMYVSGDSITASHIHAGDVNSAGPIMVFTFGGPVTGRVDGPFRFGHITRQSQFSGAFTFDSLITRLRAGTSYLNVHSRQYPAGELRGQLVR